MDYIHKPVDRHQIDSQSLTVGPRQPALYANMEVHPVKTIQENLFVQSERQNLQQMSVLYGSHMPMRVVLERSMLAQTRRLGGHGSSMFGLNMHMDRYDDLDFADVLNDPYMTPEMPVYAKEGISTHMEREFGMRA